MRPAYILAMDDNVHSAAMFSRLYDQDFGAWALDQAARLRQAEATGPAGLDWLNLAEEIDGLVRSDKRALGSHVRVIVEHLIKLQASLAKTPRNGWMDSVSTARREAQSILEDSPSLAAHIPFLLERALGHARQDAGESLARYGETPIVDPRKLVYTPEQILGHWWPE